MSRQATDINDQDLEDLLINHEGFFAVACLSFASIPCDHFRPEYEALAEALKEWAGFRRLDVDENPTITESLRVTAVPTTLLFKNGEELKRWEGPYTREALESRMREEIRRTA